MYVGACVCVCVCVCVKIHISHIQSVCTFICSCKIKTNRVRKTRIMTSGTATSGTVGGGGARERLREKPGIRGAVQLALRALGGCK